jgi:hypothetical protein
MPTLGTLAAGIQSVSAQRRSEVYLTELGDDDRPLVGRNRSVPQWLKFQYFPESVADTKAVNYQPKEVPGGSLPLYQWTGSGERTISFTAYFSTDVDHLASQGSVDFDGPMADLLGDMTLPIDRTLRTMCINGAVEASQTRLRAAGAHERNPFIPGALIWLRRFMLPRYGENSEVGVPITKPPHKLLLHLTGTEMERFGGANGFSVGGGGILCVMTTCDINIEALFPTGNIRIASVSLAFAEVPQRGGVVRFPSADGLDEVAATWYPMVAHARSSSSGSLR